MGTSTNQRSPNTPNWRLALAAIGSQMVPTDRQSEEIWKAVSAERGDHLYREIGSELLALAASIAREAKSPAEAVSTFNRSIIESHAAGLTLDLGRRALARAVASGTGPGGFASELFSEITSYYVARDLPSFVGAAGRVATTTECIKLKDDLRYIARRAAQESGPVKSDVRGWRTYVRSVLTALQKGGRE